jgi:transcriptional regulator with XRE-family HTH domain
MDITLHKIFDLLWKSGVTEIDFCKNIGINKSAMTDWKKGKTKSYKKYIPEIATFFNVTPEYLFEQTFQASPNNKTEKEQMVMSIEEKDSIVKNDIVTPTRIIIESVVKQGLEYCLINTNVFMYTSRKRGVRSNLNDKSNQMIVHYDKLNERYIQNITNEPQLTKNRIIQFINFVYKNEGGEECYPTLEEYKYLRVATGQVNDKTDLFVRQLEEEYLLLKEKHEVNGLSDNDIYNSLSNQTEESIAKSNASTNINKTERMD